MAGPVCFGANPLGSSGTWCGKRRPKHWTTIARWVDCPACLKAMDRVNGLRSSPQPPLHNPDPAAPDDSTDARPKPR